MEKIYSSILNAVNNKKIGRVQAIVISLNTTKSKDELVNDIKTLVLTFTSLFDKPINNVVKFFPQPYLHGSFSVEFEGGGIFRLTLTKLQTDEKTFVTLYGTDGEIRYSSITGELKSYIQQPDYVGDDIPLTDKVIIDIANGKVGDKTITKEDYFYYHNLLNDIIC